MTTTPGAAGAPTDPAALLRRAVCVTADAERGAALLFTTSIALPGTGGAVAAARLVATSHGLYECAINGVPVTDSVLNPGWTSYEWRLQYQVFDVTALVQAAGNALRLSARVGNGWFRGDLGFDGAMINYGSDIGLLVALEIIHSDGHAQLVTTGPDWTATRCDVTDNSLYAGQRIDARLRGVPQRELAVRTASFDFSVLVPQLKPLITRQEVVAPLRIWTSPAGATLVDFGQNLVGWLRIRTGGPAGTEIVVRHAEVLEDGELSTRPLRGASATDTFVLSDRDVDEFEPTFTFHGFRYAEVAGWPGGLNIDTVEPGALEAVVVHSDMRPTSTFACSEPLVNQLVRNSVWGQKGNFLDVPTDCPQRDERLGWTGDIATYAATAAFQFDCADFLHAWLLDVAAETRHNTRSAVPVVVPDVFKRAQKTVFPDLGPQAIWGDAAVWVPQAVWATYGDLDRLATHYPVMALHLESVLPRLSESGLWDRDVQLGDWLDPAAPVDQPWKSSADPSVVATACLYRSARFAAQAAHTLGIADDAHRWESLAERTRRAFRNSYVFTAADGMSGRITSDCSTVYALAIYFGLLDQHESVWAGNRLAEIVSTNAYRVTTGFAGTPYVTWALSETGHVQDAYHLLLTRDCPSWLYPVTMGATTIWERWDSMLPDGSVNPGEMTSFNHYAFGAVADWIYQVVAGIRSDSPGYRKIKIEPMPGPGIDWVKASYHSRVGLIEVQWSIEDGRFDLDVTTPDGVDCVITLPSGSVARVSGGTHHLTCPAPIS